MKKQIFFKPIVLLLLVALFLLPSCGGSNEGNGGSGGVKEFSTKDANTVLLDKDGIKLTYTGLEVENGKYSLKLSFSNDTDKAYDVQLRDHKVDGIEDVATCSFTMEPKSSGEDEITLYQMSLEKAGIEKPKELVADVVVIFDIVEEVEKIKVKINIEE